MVSPPQNSKWSNINFNLPNLGLEGELLVNCSPKRPPWIQGHFEDIHRGIPMVLLLVSCLALLWWWLPPFWLMTQNMAAERREGWLFRCTKNVRVLHYNLCGSLEGTLRRSPRQASVPRGKPGDIEQSLYLKMRPSLFGDPSMAYVAPVVALRPGGGCQTPCGGTGERGDHVSPAVDNRHAHSVARIPHKDLAI